MSKQQQAGSNGEDLAEILSGIAEKSQNLVQDFAERQSASMGPGASADPLNLTSAFLELTQRMMTDPTAVAQAQLQLWSDYMRLWQSTAQRFWGQDVEPVATPERGDRRFKDASWSDNALFDYVKQSYLLSSRFLMDQVGEERGLDAKTQQKVEFYTRQFVDAMAPSNFVATNPEVLRATVDSRGENLLRGLENLLGDLERGKGQLRVSMTDHDAFELGVNVATTPGKVVYQNHLMQLLQYSPSTEEVYKKPLLIIPPWINKFYILDLQAKNSFIKYCVDQGFTTFVISWVNPDEKLSHKSFEDYMLEGPLDALQAMEKATGEKSATVIGYCLGGTLLSATLAYMGTKKDERFEAATFFTTMMDFAEPGDLGVFIDEEQLGALEEQMAKQGYLDGSSMATTFNMLRANDLIWSFVVSNYLLGKDPFPFDLLYWNSDSTRMPEAMHSFYLRKFYHENKLVEPGGVQMCGTPVDLTTIDTPAYWVSTKEDHIAPWKSTYAGTQMLKGERRFVLAGSGHIAGVVNPPAAGKYGHWTNDDLPADPDQWREGATYHEGSWWDDWASWNGARSGEKVAARTPGDGELDALEDAPGSYVKVQVK